MPDDMSDSAQSASKLKEILDVLAGTISSVSEKLKGMNSTAKDSFDNMSASYKTLFEDINKNADAIDSFGRGTDNMTISMDKLVGSFIRFKEFLPNEQIFNRFASTASSQFGSVSDNVQAMSTDLSLLDKAARGLHLPVDKFEALIKAMASNAAQGQAAEAQFLNMMTAAGRLNEVLGDQVGGIQNVDGATSEYLKQINNIAAATGFTNRQTLEYMDSLGRVPGFLNGITMAGQDNQQAMENTIATLRLMSGSMQSAEAISQEMTTAFENLSQANGKIANTGQVANQFIATLSEINRNGNVRLEDARGLLEDVARQFKFVGDETAGAANIVQRFNDALQGTGLTAKASVDMIKQMIDGVNGLSMGTKAFLSIRSGGPGGLQGALQIEQLLREGKLDQVMGMMERSLRQQFGGRIYTQAEGARSPEAAAEFTRQRMLLQSGVFGIGKGMTDEQATRMLEALRNNNVGQLQNVIKTGQDAVRDVSSIGNEWQQKNYTVLTRMSQFSERTTMAAEMQAMLMLREHFGQQSNQFMSRAADEATVDAKRKGDARGMREREASATLDQMISQAAPMFMESARGLLSGSKELVGRGVAALQEEFDNAQDNTYNQPMDKNTLAMMQGEQTTQAKPEPQEIHIKLTLEDGIRADVVSHTNPVKTIISAVSPGGNTNSMAGY